MTVQVGTFASWVVAMTGQCKTLLSCGSGSRRDKNHAKCERCKIEFLPLSAAACGCALGPWQTAFEALGLDAGWCSLTRKSGCLSFSGLFPISHDRFFFFHPDLVGRSLFLRVPSPLSLSLPLSGNL